MKDDSGPFQNKAIYRRAKYSETTVLLNFTNTYSYDDVV